MREGQEGLAIAESAGFDPMAAINVLTETLFPSPIYRNYGKAIAEKKDVNIGKIPAKDLGLFSELASEHGWPNPITQLLLQFMPPSDK